MKRLVGTCVLLILIGGQRAAAPVIAAPVRFPVQQSDQRSVSPYEFLRTVIDCLARAHDSVTAVNGQASDDFNGKMMAMRNGSIELNLAAEMVKPFTRSGDDKVKTASEVMLIAFGDLRTSFEIQRALYEKVDAATSVSELAGLGPSISDATELYEQSSTLLIVAAVAVGSAVVPDRSDPQNHIALQLSDEEKAALVQTLKARFDVMVATNKDDTGPMEAAKVMLSALDHQPAG